MKSKNLFLLLFIVTVAISCNNKHDYDSTDFKGERNIIYTICNLDSIKFEDVNASGIGGFFLSDSTINFFDHIEKKVFRYNAQTGQFICSLLEKGNGPKEINGIYQIFPDIDNNQRWVILDPNYYVSVYDAKNDTLIRKGFLDYGWKDLIDNDYDNISNYQVMEPSNFGTEYYMIGDSLLIHAISPTDRQFSEITMDKFKKSHIIAEVDLSTMQVGKPKGRMPSIYTSKPTVFTGFHYSLNLSDSILYVNHEIDSLIYVYKYPDKLLYTMGYEIPGIGRDYTRKLFYEGPEMRDFRKAENNKVGINIGLWMDKETELLFRDAYTNINSANCYLQAYKDNNLVLEESMPIGFKLLGKYKDHYYGVKWRPEETEDRVYFTFYRFEIKHL